MAVKHIDEITLAVGQRTHGTVIFAKQGDEESRFLRVTLVRQERQDIWTRLVLGAEEPLIPEAGAQAQLRAILPDGTPVTVEAVIEDGGTVLAELPPELLAQRGRVPADIAIIGASGEILSSEVFPIMVQGAPT